MAGKAEEVRALAGLELESTSDGAEDLRRSPNIPTLFEPGVPGQADTGEIGDLFSSQTWGPAPLTGLETDGSRGNPRAAALQEIAKLGAGGGGVNTRITRHLVTGYRTRHDRVYEKGWLTLGDQVTLRTVAAVAVILVGVVLIVWSSRQSPPAAETKPEPAAAPAARAA